MCVCLHVDVCVFECGFVAVRVAVCAMECVTVCAASHVQPMYICVYIYMYICACICMMNTCIYV